MIGRQRAQPLLDLLDPRFVERRPGRLGQLRLHARLEFLRRPRQHRPAEDVLGPGADLQVQIAPQRSVRLRRRQQPDLGVKVTLGAHAALHQVRALLQVGLDPLRLLAVGFRTLERRLQQIGLQLLLRELCHPAQGHLADTHRVAGIHGQGDATAGQLPVDLHLRPAGANEVLAGEEGQVIRQRFGRRPRTVEGQLVHQHRPQRLPLRGLDALRPDGGGAMAHLFRDRRSEQTGQQNRQGQASARPGGGAAAGWGTRGHGGESSSTARAA